MSDKARCDFLKVVKELEECSDPIEKREKLLESGFEFFDDEGSGEANEILEEQSAKPETDRQHKLVSFFEGTDDPSLEILGYFTDEKYSDDINYPLIRRYFRTSNQQLKRMILYGLEQDPLNTGFLSDLMFFNEYKLDLKELIRFYYFACQESQDEVVFRELAKDFYESTHPHGYDAFYELINDNAVDMWKKVSF